MNPTKEEMLTVINKEIADKIPSFWCRIEVFTARGTKYDDVIVTMMETGEVFSTKEHRILEDYEFSFEVIGHPVMIWDVFAWISKSRPEYEWRLCDFHDWYLATEELWILMWWWLCENMHNKRQHLRKPIEEQPVECIEFIYNLVMQWIKNKK